MTSPGIDRQRLKEGLLGLGAIGGSITFVGFLVDTGVRTLVVDAIGLIAIAALWYLIRSSAAHRGEWGRWAAAAVRSKRRLLAVLCAAPVVISCVAGLRSAAAADEPAAAPTSSASSSPAVALVDPGVMLNRLNASGVGHQSRPKTAAADAGPTDTALPPLSRSAFDRQTGRLQASPVITTAAPAERFTAPTKDELDGMIGRWCSDSGWGLTLKADERGLLYRNGTAGAFDETSVYVSRSVDGKLFYLAGAGIYGGTYVRLSRDGSGLNETARIVDGSGATEVYNHYWSRCA